MNENLNENLTAFTMMIEGDGGEMIEAYEARPQEDRRRGGVVIIHHRPGYDRETKEAVRRFAAMGYDTVCPNLFWREAPGAAPEDAAAVSRERGGVPDARLIGDVAGAAAHLRALDSSNGKVGVLGYCSGGRQSVLAACTLDFDAAVDCYGGYVTGTPPEDYPVPISNIVDKLPGLGCPLLGLFGDEDTSPLLEHVVELDEILTAIGKEHEFHIYAGAGHAFFSVVKVSVDNIGYHPEAAVDGWRRITDFFGRYLDT
jgi:carboxymethylenebutenolidase